MDEDEDEIKGPRYVLLPFISFLPLSRKLSNYLSDPGKQIRSLNHLVYIPKNCYSRIANFALEFSGRKSSKAQKKIYISRVREGLKSYSASTAFTAYGITSHHRLIRKRLESHLLLNYRQNLRTQLCGN